MAYDPADLRLPSWLLRLFDALIRLRIPLTPSLKFGMTRPGVMLIAVWIGLWSAAFYSGNNLLYLCGAMLSALIIVSIWQGISLLKKSPAFTSSLPEYTEAGEMFALREEIEIASTTTGMIDMQWFAGEVLINSMNGNHESRITNSCVENLTNSGAIARDSRLGLGDSESHEFPSRINQHFPDGAYVSLQLRLDRPALLIGRLLAQKRGIYSLKDQKLTTSAPLGLWQLSYTRDDPSVWVVLPKPVPWQAAALGSDSQTRAFEGDELRDLRSYLPGDPISRIHWRKAAVDSSRWSVKRFEAHQSETEEMRLRVDFRLPETATPESFEQLLGQAWYWVDHHLKNGVSSIEVVLHQQLFDLSQHEQRASFVKALAEAEPQHSSPAGQGGMLLSLVESS